MTICIILGNLHLYQIVQIMAWSLVITRTSCDFIKCVCPSYGQSDHMTVTWSSVYVHIMVNLIIWQWLDQVCMSILSSIRSYDSDLIKCVCPSYSQSDHMTVTWSSVYVHLMVNLIIWQWLDQVCMSILWSIRSYDSDLIKCVCPSYGQSDHMTVTWSSVYVHLIVNLIIWQWLDQVCMSILWSIWSYDIDIIKCVCPSYGQSDHMTVTWSSVYVHLMVNLIIWQWLDQVCMSILWSIWSYDSDLIKCVCPSYGQSDHDSDLIKCVCPSYGQSDHMTVIWSSVYVHLMVNLIMTVTWSSVYVHLMVNLIIWQWPNQVCMSILWSIWSWQWLDQVCMSILWSIWSYDSNLIKCVCPSYGQSDHDGDLIKCGCPSYGQSDHDSDLIKCVCPSYGQSDHMTVTWSSVYVHLMVNLIMTVTWSSVYVHLMVNLIIWQWLDQVCMSILWSIWSYDSDLIKCVCPSYGQSDHGSDLIKCVCPSYGQSDHMTVTWSSVYVHLMVYLIIWQWLDQVRMSILWSIWSWQWLDQVCMSILWSIWS